MKCMFLVLIHLHVISAAHAQLKLKPSVDSTVYGKWPHLSDWETPILNNTGTYVCYTLHNSPIGSYTSIIQSTIDSHQIVFPGVRSQDVRFHDKYVFLSKEDSLVIVNLQSGAKRLISEVSSYAVNERFPSRFIYKKNDTVFCRELDGDSNIYFIHVKNYKVSDNGRSMVIECYTDLSKLNDLELKYIDLQANFSRKIFSGTARQYVFDSTGTQLIFIAEKFLDTINQSSVLYYKEGYRTAKQLFTSWIKVDGITWVLSESDPVFTEDGRRIRFNMKKCKQNVTNNGISESDASVDIWSYFDMDLQPKQLLQGAVDTNFSREYSFIYDIKNNKLARLNFGNEILFTTKNSFSIVGNEIDISYDFLIKPNEPKTWVVYHSNGKREELFSQPSNLFCSPSGKFIVYWNHDLNQYHVLNTINRGRNSITNNNVSELWIDSTKDVPGVSTYFGVAGWKEKDSEVLIYDEYDIWLVNLEGKGDPKCVTRGYGRKNKIVFRVEYFNSDRYPLIKEYDKLLLTALNRKNKYNGFYTISLNSGLDPELLTMDPAVYHLRERSANNTIQSHFEPAKAKKADIYLVTRQSASEMPNLFLTSDFKVFRPLTELHPHTSYNWLTSELITWKIDAEHYSQGILYKPQNFDSTKKYPVIFHFYEKLSDGLYLFKMPDWSIASIDIPTYVSNEYLVFVPDIYYEIGNPGERILASVISAAQHIAKLPFVDTDRMGLQGHSYGGYEVNYIVTHTGMFAAAMEAAGQTNLISGYGSIGYSGRSLQFQYERGQQRIGFSLWDRPDLYLRNSPIFNANKITTPLLIMHNKEDNAVPWSHGIELFNACRRLGKPCWMLQYDCSPRQGHQLVNILARKDYTIRVQQFFDRYLKGKPAPKWMTKGVPAKEKKFFSGIDLDTGVTSDAN